MRLFRFTDRCRVFVNRSLVRAVLNVVDAFVLMFGLRGVIAGFQGKGKQEAGRKIFHAFLLRFNRWQGNGTMVPRRTGEV